MIHTLGQAPGQYAHFLDAPHLPPHYLGGSINHTEMADVNLSGKVLL